jgi:transcriptional regulator with XRE-family HTH domain
MSEGSPSNQPVPELSIQDQAVAKELAVLGAQLRQAREAKGLALPELAKRLFFRQEQLEALEAGDRAALPELVYVIAQAQRVAGVLGLDVAPLLQPLRNLQKSGPAHRCLDPSSSRSPQTAPGSASPAAIRRGAARPGAVKSGAASAVVRALAVVALIVGGAAALVWGWRRFDAGALQTWLPAQPAAPADETAANQAGNAANAPAAAPASPLPAPGDLLLSSSAPSWLEVRQVGGAAGEEVVFRGTFKGERRFPLGEGLKVLAGRPDLVTARLAGKPAQRLGSIEQVQWRTFKTAEPEPAAANP